MNHRWPDRPIVPDEWTDDSGYHPYVVAAISEGFCPKHTIPLSAADALTAADFCSPCGVSWELTNTAGTISTFGAPPPPFAVTEGTVVLVSRYL